MTIAASVIGAESRGGRPYLWADPAAVPIIPVIPLDVLEELTAAGASLQVVMIACRAIARMVFGGQAPPVVAPVAPVAPESPVSQESPLSRDMSPGDGGQPLSAKERKRLRDKVRVRNLRAAARAATEATPASDKSDSSSDSTGALSLSLQNYNCISSRERERQSRSESPVSPAGGDTSPTGLVPMTPDWQPGKRTQERAVVKFGDIGAAEVLDGYRDRFMESGELHTLAQWRAHYASWVTREERVPASSQREMPLMRQFNGGQSHGRNDRPAWQRQRDEGRIALRELKDELASRFGSGSSG